MFVSVSSGTSDVMTSFDGYTWTSQPISVGNLSWFNVAYGNGLFVVAGGYLTSNGAMVSGLPIKKY